MVHMKGYMYKWIMQDLGEKAIIYSQARQPFRNLQMLQRVSNSAVSKTCTEGGRLSSALQSGGVYLTFHV